MGTRFPYGFGIWDGLWSPNGTRYPFKTGQVSRLVPLPTPTPIASNIHLSLVYAPQAEVEKECMSRVSHASPEVSLMQCSQKHDSI
ncbi:unnamed protein product [Linum trigynum]|uniref:Uncharacterized protein n=1 Tax=Linum trigynum TaxID=586398 RepID=A0AAV2FDD0_9ROSI